MSALTLVYMLHLRFLILECRNLGFFLCKLQRKVQIMVSDNISCAKCKFKHYRDHFRETNTFMMLAHKGIRVLIKCGQYNLSIWR